MENNRLKILKKCETHVKILGLELEFKQSNVEGEIANFIQSAQKKLRYNYKCRRIYSYICSYIRCFTSS